MTAIHIITLFPEYFEALKKTGVVGSFLRGDRGPKVTLKFYNPSDFGSKGFKGVDSAPYGGGAGQVMRADILEETLVKGVFSDKEANRFHVFYLGPRGKTFDQEKAQDLAKVIQVDPKRDAKEVVFVCGRYEGIDERFLEKYVDEHLSLGDFVLSGGEVALNAILDATFRLLPGVLGNGDSPVEESFDGGGIEFPQYTKPQIACEQEVPSILLSGHHEKIKNWRKEKRREMTLKYRPELLESERKDKV